MARQLGRLPALDFAILHPVAGERVEKRAMSYHSKLGRWMIGQPSTEGMNPLLKQGMGLGCKGRCRVWLIVPPDVIKMIKVERRKVMLQFGWRAADIATALQPLAVPAGNIEGKVTPPKNA